MAAIRITIKSDHLPSSKKTQLIPKPEGESRSKNRVFMILKYLPNILINILESGGLGGTGINSTVK